MSFFEKHSRFFETSTVGAWPLRLALRHHAVIESNARHFAGARVLDLASHDGRWSLAALAAGAAHVTGVEARPDLVAAAEANLTHYGVPRDAFRFIVGDLNHQLRAPGAFDIVLCLGYFYHTLNHLALWEYIASTGARHVILDGMVHPSEDLVIRMLAEPVDDDANGASTAGEFDGKVLVGHPTKNALALMLRHFGYECAFFDWADLQRTRGVVAEDAPQSASNPVGDYAFGRRVTALATRVG